MKDNKKLETKKSVGFFNFERAKQLVLSSNALNNSSAKPLLNSNTNASSQSKATKIFKESLGNTVVANLKISGSSISHFINGNITDLKKEKERDTFDMVNISNSDASYSMDHNDNIEFRKVKNFSIIENEQNLDEDLRLNTMNSVNLNRLCIEDSEQVNDKKDTHSVNINSFTKNNNNFNFNLNNLNSSQRLTTSGSREGRENNKVCTNCMILQQTLQQKMNEFLKHINDQNCLKVEIELLTDHNKFLTNELLSLKKDLEKVKFNNIDISFIKQEDMTRKVSFLIKENDGLKQQMKIYQARVDQLEELVNDYYLKDREIKDENTINYSHISNSNILQETDLRKESANFNSVLSLENKTEMLENPKSRNEITTLGCQSQSQFSFRNNIENNKEGSLY